MTDSYTKLFASITESTIWGEPAGTRLVWITMLARCNRKGEVYGSVPGLARLANVPQEECESALRTLTSPDKWSRTPDNEGRRIEPIDGGWRILNHAKFDALRSEIEANERRKEYQRDWDRANRPSGYARQSDKSPTQSDAVRLGPTQSDVSPTQSDPPLRARAINQKQDQDQKNSNRGARLPDGWEPSQAVRQWASARYPALDLTLVLEDFSDYWKGIPGQKGCKLDWDATFRNRVRSVARRPEFNHGNAVSSTGRKLSAVERTEANIAERKRLEREAIARPSGQFLAPDGGDVR